ncbi:molybdopterin-guanine dinucleotide biosynthesis protein A [Nitrobacter hamburgensis X14]|uniref:Molybdopterin-guanine dinucleotide biosynthesis protein A n=1 Tax=Nitrobacter hamburgensis (strain DSM 10229 / NCIMB 13809 / X14) TaxID=323097 RepID=Q1QIT9_NITHX|nr:DUF3305 domain-containing protein [Nitrobacter hamburgensis]ABE63858.1 molybdopterin-guanine dinucleotide biosynthesis protein A [Nitrobacter hamburgensis X14]
MSPAASPLVRIPVGVVIERRAAASAWTDFIWRAVGVLPGAPDIEPWTTLRADADGTLYYAGSAAIDLYRSETGRYRENLASGAAIIWVVMSPSEGPWPYAITAVTADSAEGESFTDASANLVEAVPMPDVIRGAIERFIAEHHVEREEFVKRKRGRADLEALGRRARGGRDE